jgi:hypothetical protein
MLHGAVECVRGNKWHRGTVELSNGIIGTWCCEIMGVNKGYVGTAKFIR